MTPWVKFPSLFLFFFLFFTARQSPPEGPQTSVPSSCYSKLESERVPCYFSRHLQEDHVDTLYGAGGTEEDIHHQQADKSFTPQPLPGRLLLYFACQE